MLSCGLVILLGMSEELSVSWVDRRDFPRSTAELDEEPEFEQALATLLHAFEGLPVWQVPEKAIVEQGLSREQFTYWHAREQRELRSNSRPLRPDRLRPLRLWSRSRAGRAPRPRRSAARRPAASRGSPADDRPRPPAKPGRPR